MITEKEAVYWQNIAEMNAGVIERKDVLLTEAERDRDRYFLKCVEKHELLLRVAEMLLRVAEILQPGITSREDWPDGWLKKWEGK